MSVAVQQQMVSGREEELGEIFRTMLEWNNYAAAVNGPHATVQQLRDLITNSVTMETGGEPLISALCTISSSTDDFIVSFDRLVHFVQHDPDPPKTELSQRLLYPLFVHCYLFLIASDDAAKAHKLYRHFADTVANKGSPEVRELEQISSLEDLTQSSLAEKFRSHKYFVRMSHSSFVLLITFLQTNQTPVLINIIQKYIQIEVFGSSTQSNGENKTDSKRNTFPLMKPRIDVFGFPPKRPAVMYMTPAVMYMTPATPPTLREPSPAKAEFKERLNNAVSQLDPTAPSLLVYTVSSPNNTAPVKCNSALRLQHLSTKLFLHSHHFSSPLSGNQEVSAFGDGSDGDRGDNWVVECDDDYWRRDDMIRFKHKDTNMYLHATGHQYGRPIAGQKEISAHAHKSDNNLWKACMEGVFMEPTANNKPAH